MRCVIVGPTTRGIWYGSQVCLGMRRLSVIDLSTGHQPIFNEDRSVCVVYNGETYNFQELRQELQARGHRFATSSDTEVIVHGWEEWGEDVASRLNGMFAFALWDERRRLLWLVRDRLGIKPLYYRHEPGRRLLFASEIKSILAHPDVPRDVDQQGLFNFLAYGHAVGPDSIYRGIQKLMPGHALRIERGEVSAARLVECRSGPGDRAHRRGVALERPDAAGRQHPAADGRRRPGRRVPERRARFERRGRADAAQHVAPRAHVLAWLRLRRRLQRAG